MQFCFFHKEIDDSPISFNDFQNSVTRFAYIIQETDNEL